LGCSNILRTFIVKKNNQVLYLDLNEYPAGVAFWPSFWPAFSSRQGGEKHELVDGIHVHARKKPGKQKAIDATFDKLFVKLPVGHTHPSDYLEVDYDIATSFWNSSVFQIPMEYLECPRCSEAHTDHNLDAVTPHTNHCCEHCGFEFISANECVGNSLILLKNLFKDVDDQRLPLEVDRPIEINSQDFPGGIMMWGTAPGILWTFQAEQEAGIHLHCYDDGGKKLIHDDTYSVVTVDGMPIQNIMLRYLSAQQKLSHLKGLIESVECPICSEWILDTGRDACIPHLDFCCSNGHNFSSSKKVVSNPVSKVFQKLPISQIARDGSIVTP
jgi:hypothetical protein